MTQTPPLAQPRPIERTHHGDTVVDDYDWLRDGDDPEVVKYLRAENDWCEARTSHLAPSVDELTDDLEARMLETDMSTPQLVHHELAGERRSYWYYIRIEEGNQYPLLSRLPVLINAPPDPWGGPEGVEILFDGNVEAENETFSAMGAMKVSPDGRLLAYLIDRSGDERFTLYLRDLVTGAQLDEPITDVGHQLCWIGNSWLGYVRHDDAMRPYVAWQHRVGTDSSHDIELYSEPDEKFRLLIKESRDRRWTLLVCSSPTSSETRIRLVVEPEGDFRLVTPRAGDVQYHVELAGDRLLILHDANGPDFELAQAPLEATSAAQWVPLIPHEAGTRLIRVDAYLEWAVLSLRRDGRTAVFVMPRNPNENFGHGEDLEFEEATYEVGAEPGPNYDDLDIRLSYASLLCPPQILSYNVQTRQRRSLKEMQVLDHPDHGPYVPADYEVRREFATAEDGTKIPISLVAARATFEGGPAPTILYGYGAYELPTEPSFDGLRVSLMDKGFVYAIAHVRGGGEMGRPWFTAGSQLAKMNSFTDFIACAHHLIEAGVSDPDRIGAQGMSAGGLLVGAAVNLEPGLFRAVQADVPFVDPLTTGLDPDLPLTVAEWEQWGDPLHDPEAYAYIKSYAPVENVQATRYPAMLVTASLKDNRVSFGEAAKWVARLRATAEADDDRQILLKVETDAGHGGVSGRYDQWAESAFRMAWLMDQLAPEQ